MKTKYKKILPFLTAPLAVVAPVMVAISCGESSSAAPVNPEVIKPNVNEKQIEETFKLNYDSLLNLDFRGDTKHFTFFLPVEVDQFNNRTMTELKLKYKPIDVYARFVMPVANEIAVNRAWMPMYLMQAYLANQVTWQNNMAYIDTANGKQPVSEVFGHLFNFNALNVSFNAAAQSMKEVALDALELKYHLSDELNFSEYTKFEASKVVRPMLKLKKWTYIETPQDAEHMHNFLKADLQIDLAATPTNAVLKWNKAMIEPEKWPKNWNEKVDKIVYAIVSDAALNAPSQIKWSDTIPTAAPYLIGRDWNLVAKAIAKNNSAFDPGIFNLTQFTNIRKLKLDIATSDTFKYVNMDLIEASINNQYNQIIIDESKFRDKIIAAVGVDAANAIKVSYSLSVSDTAPYISEENKKKWLDITKLASGFNFKTLVWNALVSGTKGTNNPQGGKLETEIQKIYAKIEISDLPENSVFNSPVVQLTKVQIMKNQTK